MDVNRLTILNSCVLLSPKLDDATHYSQKCERATPLPVLLDSAGKILDRRFPLREINLIYQKQTQKEYVVMPSKRRYPALSKLFMLSASFLLSLLSINAVHAQTSTVGNINGTVRDPQGAGVPKVEIILKEERTGLSRSVKTDDNGFYSALSLPAGVYTVIAAPQGFKKTANTGLELHVS